MAMERTFSIIKPDAVAKNVIGKIISRFEKAGLRIVASRMERLSVESKILQNTRVKASLKTWRLHVFWTCDCSGSGRRRRDRT